MATPGRPAFAATLDRPAAPDESVGSLVESLLPAAVAEAPALHFGPLEKQVFQSCGVLAWGYNARLQHVSTRAQAEMAQPSTLARAAARMPATPRFSSSWAVYVADQLAAAAVARAITDVGPPRPFALRVSLRGYRGLRLTGRAPPPPLRFASSWDRCVRDQLHCEPLRIVKVKLRGAERPPPPPAKRRRASNGAAASAPEPAPADDGLVVDGYEHLLLSALRDDRVTYEMNFCVASVVAADGAGDGNATGPVVVTSSDQRQLRADAVVCTLPLGVLKRHHETIFRPPLSADKRRAIDALGAGVENKVLLQYDEPFWPEAAYFQSTDQRVRFINLHAFGKHGLVCAHTSPPFAEGFAGLSDVDVVREVERLLVAVSPSALEPAQLLDYVVTHWEEDPLALGSYSYAAVGARDDERDRLQAPDWLDDRRRPKLFFAGEACSRLSAQCVHGAVETGETAARQVLRTRDAEVLGDEARICVCGGRAETWETCYAGDDLIECEGCCGRWLHAGCCFPGRGAGPGAGQQLLCEACWAARVQS